MDFLINAYRYGSFDKLIEFINLRHRLSSSQQFASLSIEQVLLKLLETSEYAQVADILIAHQVDPERDDIPWPELTDNRDFKVMTSWDPIDRWALMITACPRGIFIQLCLGENHKKKSTNIMFRSTR